MVGIKPEKVSLLTVRFLMKVIPVTPGCRLPFSDGLWTVRIWKVSQWSLELEGSGRDPLLLLRRRLAPRAEGLLQGHTAN